VENFVVVNADTDGHGAKKENIFIALDGNGEYLGSLLIYPYFDYDLEPEHPHNLQLYLHAGQGKDLSESVKDLLLEHALRRATEIKRDAEQTKTWVYAWFLKHQQKEIAYFLQRGFTHDEGMHILERYDSAAPPQAEAPEEVTIQAWKMETDAEQRQFTEAHRRVFPRHTYSTERLQELKSLPGWENFTAFSHTEIAGNIMMFTKRDNDTTGYIEDLFVQKQWRRRGIGRCLLCTALAHFHSIGIHRVQLEFWSANKPALRLYRAFGFSSIDETKIAVGRYV
jgi:ribosomal protein S18 acetylase RimI-like enzyme